MKKDEKGTDVQLPAEYRVVRGKRRTVAVQITRDGEIVVCCPERMTEEEISRFVGSKKKWIQKHLARREAVPKPKPLTRAQVRELMAQAQVYIPERVEYFGKRMGVTWGEIRIHKAHTIWGSCGGKGNLNFNCLLMLTPPEVLDYVVVHELCHRRVMDHSARFWAEVEREYPDYRRQIQWLNAEGEALLDSLPGAGRNSV